MSDCFRAPASRKLARNRLTRPLQTPSASRMLGTGEHHVRQTEKQEMLTLSINTNLSQSLCDLRGLNLAS
jgi:hypothetical protein